MASFFQKILAIFIWLIGKAPLALRRAFGRLFGRVFQYIPTRERTIARLQLAFFLPDHSTDKLLSSLYQNFGQTMMETLNLEPILKADDVVEVVGAEQLTPILESGKPLVTLTAHTGNWDLLAAYFVRKGIQISTIGRPSRNAVFQSILQDIRDGYGVETIWRTKSAGRKALQSLRQGKVLAALIDQDTTVNSIFTSFFGHPVKTPSGLISIAKRSKANIVSAFIFRIDGSRFRIFVEPIDTGLSDEEILGTYHQRLEKYIRLYPDQWVWFHKRWRSLPSGKTFSSKEYIAILKESIKSQSPLLPSHRGAQ